ncbi:Rab family protein [Pelomyxa schiedti]|nr:Rab family protein [Pelomyxa schiedti]
MAEPFKVILIGDTGAGKTALMHRLKYDMFFETEKPDRTEQYCEKEFDGDTIQLWDTADQEKWTTVNSSYYRGAQGVLLVFDTTTPDTFGSIKGYHAEVQKYANGEGLAIILVGTKTDLPAEINDAQIKEACDRFGFKSHLTSAKTGDGIDTLWKTVIAEIKEQRRPPEEKAAPVYHITKEEPAAAEPAKKTGKKKEKGKGGCLLL